MRTTLLLILACSWLCAAQSTDYFQQEISYAIEARLDEPDARACTAHLTPDSTPTTRPVAPRLNRTFTSGPGRTAATETAFARQMLRNGNTRFHFAAMSPGAAP